MPVTAYSAVTSRPNAGGMVHAASLPAPRLRGPNLLGSACFIVRDGKGRYQRAWIQYTKRFRGVSPQSRPCTACSLTGPDRLGMSGRTGNLACWGKGVNAECGAVAAEESSSAPGDMPASSIPPHSTLLRRSQPPARPVRGEETAKPRLAAALFRLGSAACAAFGIAASCPPAHALESMPPLPPPTPSVGTAMPSEGPVVGAINYLRRGSLPTCHSMEWVAAPTLPSVANKAAAPCQDACGGSAQLSPPAAAAAVGTLAAAPTGQATPGVSSSPHACVDGLASLSLASNVRQAKDKCEGLFWLLSNARAWSMYRMDFVLERYPQTYFLLLIVLVSTIVVVGGLAFYSVNMGISLTDALWRSWSCVTATSSHTKEITPTNRLIALLLCFGGVFFYSLLTSTISVNMKARMEDLRAGAHTKAIEHGHIVIVGVNDHLQPLIQQLSMAHDFHRHDYMTRWSWSRPFAPRDAEFVPKKQTVIVLSDKPKSAIEKSLSWMDKSNAWNLNVLCRSGNLGDSRTYDKVSADKAKSVVFLAQRAGREGDSDAVVSLSALQRLIPKFKQDVVVQVSKSSSGALLKSGLGMNIQSVENLSSKLFVQCARQPGLASVYTELMSHSGMVINIRSYPELAGVPYGTVRQQAVVCGLINYKGDVSFCPADERILQANDKLLVISRKQTFRKLPPSLMDIPTHGKSTAVFETKLSRMHRRTATEVNKSNTQGPELVVVIGWRKGVADIASELDLYCGAGSELVIVSDTRIKDRESYMARKLPSPLKNINVTHMLGSGMSRTDLTDAIVGTISRRNERDKEAAKMPLRVSVMAVSSEEPHGSTDNGKKVDKEVVYSVLQAEDICKQHGITPWTLAAELVDSNLGNQMMKSHPSISFISSSEMMALFTSQVIEHYELNKVWTELLNAYGFEIYIKNLRRYADPSERLSFKELAERTRALQEVVIGYRKDAVVTLNPERKTEPLDLSENDGLVVFAKQA
eukprot:jgi/Mesvir1/15892/Mv02796-RA.2